MSGVTLCVEGRGWRAQSKWDSCSDYIHALFSSRPRLNVAVFVQVPFIDSQSLNTKRTLRSEAGSDSSKCGCGIFCPVVISKFTLHGSCRLLHLSSPFILKQELVTAHIMGYSASKAPSSTNSIRMPCWSFWVIKVSGKGRHVLGFEFKSSSLGLYIMVLGIGSRRVQGVVM